MGAPNTIRRRCFTNDTCDWCGRLRRRVYKYGVLKGLFCNIDCMCSFHDLDRNRLGYVEPERK